MNEQRTLVVVAGVETSSHVLAAAIGWLLLCERIQPLTLVGFGIIIAGFTILESGEIGAELAKYRSLYR